VGQFKDVLLAALRAPEMHHGIAGFVAITIFGFDLYQGHLELIVPLAAANVGAHISAESWTPEMVVFGGGGTSG